MIPTSAISNNEVDYRVLKYKGACKQNTRSYLYGRRDETLDDATQLYVYSENKINFACL